jgi:DNA-binding GntR family transcriptional regulator
VSEVAELNEDNSLAEKIVEVMFHERAFEDNPLTEKFLSSKFDTSRTPIRDALKTLESDDIIERKKKKGVYLKRPSPKVIAELYDLRTVLEGFAIRNAVENAGEEHLAKLGQLAKEFSEAKENGNIVTAENANREFHAEIIRLSGNEMLDKMMNNVNIIRRAFQYAYSLKPELHEPKSPSSHENIVEAMKQRDKDKSEELMKRHVLIGKQRTIEQALGFKMGNQI